MTQKGLNLRPDLFGNLLQPVTVATLLKRSFFFGIYVKLRDLIVFGTGPESVLSLNSISVIWP